MKKRTRDCARILGLFLLAQGGLRAEQPAESALAAFEAMSRGVDARAGAPISSGRELNIERLPGTAGPELKGALLHHWAGTSFVPGARAADFERVLRDFAGYPRYFAPQVLRADVSEQSGDRMKARMRFQQHNMITVTLDTTYDVVFGQSGDQRGYSTSHCIRIDEVEGAGTRRERVLRPDESHGFLWRLNSWWSWEERDGGLYLRLETLSLTRSVPMGLGWAVQPYVESIPRKSLEFTLRSAQAALEARSRAEGAR